MTSILITSSIFGLQGYQSVTFTADIVDIYFVEPQAPEEIGNPPKHRNDEVDTSPIFPSPKKSRA